MQTLMVRTVLALGLAWVWCAAGEAVAPSALTPAVNFAAGVYNKYIWRYAVVTNEAVLQSNLSASLAGFSAGVWGNMDLTDYHRAERAGHFTELDWTLAYGNSLGPVAFKGGIIGYSFPSTGTPGTYEIFADVSAALPGVGSYLVPGAAVYYDIDDAKSALFAEPYLAGSAALPPAPFPVRPEAIGWRVFTGLTNGPYNRFGFGVGGEAWLGAGAELRLPCKVDGAPFLTVTPSIAFTTIIDEEIRDAARHDDNVLVGLTLSLDF
ncbi:MAG TPA: hypothetical protein DCM87_01555 [Planctomycetes bacterium]|nr:hypothetical protein [Planctomycetota bacterium]